jgi:hypothetical protein
MGGAAWSYIKPPRSKEGACETAHLYIAGVGTALGTCEDDVMQELSRYGTVQHLLMEADKVTTSVISHSYLTHSQHHRRLLIDLLVSLTHRPTASRATRQLHKL